MGSERQDVFAARPQGRQAQIDDVEPVEEIFAEGSVFDHGRQVAVGSGQDARFDGHGVVCADGPDLFFLQGAKKLGLQVERQFANLIEEDGSGFRGDQKAVFATIRAGEGALDMTEKFALDQCGDE